MKTLEKTQNRLSIMSMENREMKELLMHINQMLSDGLEIKGGGRIHNKIKKALN